MHAQGAAVASPGASRSAAPARNGRNDAFDVQKVAVAKVFDPRVVKGSHRRRRVAVLFSDNARRRWPSMVWSTPCGWRTTNADVRHRACRHHVRDGCRRSAARAHSPRAGRCSCSALFRSTSAGRGGRSRGYDRCNSTCEGRGARSACKPAYSRPLQRRGFPSSDNTGRRGQPILAHSPHPDTGCSKPARPRRHLTPSAGSLRARLKAPAAEQQVCSSGDLFR